MPGTVLRALQPHSFNPYNLARLELLILLVGRKGNGSPRGAIDSPKVTQRVSSKDRIQIQVCRHQSTSYRQNTRLSLDSDLEPVFLDFSLRPTPYQVQVEIIKQQ